MKRYYLTDGTGTVSTNNKRYADALIALGWWRISRAAYHAQRRLIERLDKERK